MKRVLAAILGLALVTVPLHAASWSAIAGKLSKSVVFVESGDGSCTGFVVDNTRDFVVTANHCDAKDLTADGIPAKVVYKDTKNDLLVLEVKGIDRPALKLAKADPKQGEEVLSFGFGYGLDRPMARVTHISDDATYIPFEGIGGPFLITDSSFVPGQSGGPVINAEGEVAMIVQMGTPLVGIGRGAEVLRLKVGRFFAESN